jgi:hypothetical protein
VIQAVGGFSARPRPQLGATRTHVFDDLADLPLQRKLAAPHFPVSRIPVTPGRKSEPFAVHQHRADNKSEDRAPVIAAACPWLALVLRQTRPKFRAGPGLQSVCSNADDPRTIAGIRRNSYYIAGAGGQTTMIVPSRDLVVVRLGHYRGETAGAAAFRKALTLLMEAVPRRN